jgi:Tol biopolymer transport system component
MVLEILPIAGGEPVQTLDIQTRAYQWSPYGDAITYAKHENDIGNLWSQPLDGGPPIQVTHFDEETIQSFASSPDGKRIAIVRQSFVSDVVLMKNFR